MNNAVYTLKTVFYTFYIDYIEIRV